MIEGTWILGEWTETIIGMVLGVFIFLWIKNNMWRFHRCSVCKKYLLTSGGNYATYTQSDGRWDVAHAKCALQGERL